MTGPGRKQRAGLLFGLGLNAPFLDPRYQHPGVEKAAFGLGRGRSGRDSTRRA
jgi:hypothetical protein